jgi:CheY-like chemotaxis protein
MMTAPSPIVPGHLSAAGGDDPGESTRDQTMRELERGDAGRATLKRRVQALASEFVKTGRYPRITDHEARSILAAQQRGADSPQYVLLAEDDGRYAERVASAFRNQLGVQVVSVPSVAEAIAAVGAHAFDLAVVDIDLLHGGTGMEVIEHARRVNPNLPVIVMSSYLDGELESLEKATQANARFDKNSLPDILVESARRLLVTDESLRSRPAT